MHCGKKGDPKRSKRGRERKCRMSAIVFHKWGGMDLLSRMCKVDPL